MQQGDRHVAGVAAIVKALEQATDAIPPLHREISEAEELGRKYGFLVGHDGEITDQFDGQPLPPDIHPEDRKRAHADITAKLQQVVRTATDIDADLAGVFHKAGTGGFGGEQAGFLSTAAAIGSASMALTTPDPPKNGTPAQNAAWWASLSKAEQNAAMHDPVNKIGNLDGVPAAARSTANMLALPKVHHRVASQLAQARSMLQDTLQYSNPQLIQQAQARVTNLENKLKALDRIGQVMNLPGQKQLIALDASKPLVQAAVARGNVDTARNVAVFTPGFTTNVQDSLADYDQRMRDLKYQADRMQPPGSPGTATVTWMGYQEPQIAGVLDPSTSVASPHAAEAGGKSLAKFYDGIGASHAAAHHPLHLTALGHSYGSTTTGEALGHHTPVNDAILFGSPGQGAQHLNVPQGHLYSERDQGDDLVPNLHGTLGPSPYFSPDVMNQYTHLSTDASPHGAASYGHSGYLDHGSTSLHNMAAITAGQAEAADYERGSR